MKTLVNIANTSWYLFNFRKPIYTIQSINKVINIAPRDEYSDKLENFRNINFIRDKLSLKKDLESIIKIIKVLQSVKNPILHLFTFKCLILGVIAGKVLGIKNIVVSIAGLGHYYSNTKGKIIVNFILRFLLKNTKIIFQNRSDLKYYINNHIIKKHNAFLIISSGADPAKIKRKITFSNSNRLSIVFISRLLKSKGILDVLKIAKVLESEKDITFSIYGNYDNSNPSAIDKHWFLSKLKGLKNVTFNGRCHDVHNVLHKYDIFLYPSYHMEGTPKILVECSLAGLPVITTHNRGCNEVISNKKYGIKCKIGDIKCFVNSILRLSSNKQQLHNYSNNNYLNGIHRFSVQNIAELTGRCYKNNF